MLSSFVMSSDVKSVYYVFNYMLKNGVVGL